MRAPVEGAKYRYAYRTHLKKKRSVSKLKGKQTRYYLCLQSTKKSISKSLVMLQTYNFLKHIRQTHSKYLKKKNKFSIETVQFSWSALVSTIYPEKKLIALNGVSLVFCQILISISMCQRH